MGIRGDCIKILFLGCLISGVISEVQAQRYDFKIYSVNDGLPQGQVHDMEQTDDGFIWMATNGGGLSRFDGHSFHTYTTREGLRNNAIQSLFEDSSGKFWIANYPGGVVTFQGDSLINPFPNDSLSYYQVWDINEFNDGEMWFATNEGGIFIWKENNFRRITVSDGLASNTIWKFRQDEDGTIWIATQKGLSVMKDGKFTNYTTKDGLSGNKVYKISTEHRGNRWIATNNGLSIWNGDQFRTIKKIDGISLDYVFDVKVAANGNIWIATETKGVFVYDGQKYIHFTKKNGLSSNFIYTLFEDDNGNMWVGTDENGVNLYRGDVFLFYDENFGLSTNEVVSLDFDRKGVLWLGTTQGINSYDGENVRHYSLPGEFENNYIWEIEELPNGNKLFLMPDQSLMEYDGQHFYNFTLKNNLGKWFIYDLFVDSKNVLWMATDEGLYSLKEGEYRNFTQRDGMVGNVIRTVFEDVEGNIYLGTYDGLSIYDGRNFTNITINDGLAHNRINYITQDPHGSIWLGTAGGISLIEFNGNKKNYNITNFGKEEGLVLLDTHFIWFDENGRLWQGTNGGLNCLDVPEYRKSGEMNVTRYALSEEGLGVEFNFKAITVDSANNAWFGSMEGALKLDVSNIEENTLKNPPRVHFTSIERNAKDVKWERLANDINYETGRMIYPSVTFPPGEHTYRFSFVGLDYLHPENVKYRYRMVGFEDEWKPYSNAASATYTNLESGDYTFMVQAATDSEKNQSEILRYNFSVAFPFWQTYWFFALILAGIVGTVYGFIKMRLGMLEKNRLQELVEERTVDLKEALADREVLIKEIHHRVKNNLAVISGLLELQRNYANDNFAGRVLSESQRRVYSIAMIHEKLYQSERLAEVNFEKYINELIEYIINSFNYAQKDINVEVNIDDFKLGVDQGIPCGLILNELISNAYEHAFTDQEEGTIEISMKVTEDNFIEMIVRDNGKGIREDFPINKSETLGLTLVNTLAKQLGGTFDFGNSGEGARFVIVFKKSDPIEKIPADK